MADGDPDDDDSAEAPDESAPLAELAEQLQQRGSGAESGFGDLTLGDAGDDADDDVFEDSSYEGIDSDTLWDALEQDEGGTSAAPGVEAGAAANEHIVPKRSYCEDCEYFSAPPQVHCNHSGTTIVEYVDLDHIRVRSCPIVQKRQELGDRDAGPIDPDEYVGPQA